jgi:hypothetical protein
VVFADVTDPGGYKVRRSEQKRALSSDPPIAAAPPPIKKPPQQTEATPQAANSAARLTPPFRRYGGGLGFACPQSIRNTGYTQSFNVSIDKAWIMAEEEFISRSAGPVIRLAL